MSFLNELKLSLESQSESLKENEYSNLSMETLCNDIRYLAYSDPNIEYFGISTEGVKEFAKKTIDVIKKIMAWISEKVNKIISLISGFFSSKERKEKINDIVNIYEKIKKDRNEAYSFMFNEIRNYFNTNKIETKINEDINILIDFDKLNDSKFNGKMTLTIRKEIINTLLIYGKFSPSPVYKEIFNDLDKSHQLYERYYHDLDKKETYDDIYETGKMLYKKYNNITENIKYVYNKLVKKENISNTKLIESYHDYIIRDISDGDFKIIDGYKKGSYDVNDSLSFTTTKESWPKIKKVINNNIQDLSFLGDEKYLDYLIEIMKKNDNWKSSAWSQEILSNHFLKNDKNKLKELESNSNDPLTEFKSLLLLRKIKVTESLLQSTAMLASESMLYNKIILEYSSHILNSFNDLLKNIKAKDYHV